MKCDILPFKIFRLLKYEIIPYARHIRHVVNRKCAVKVQRFSTDMSVSQFRVARDEESKSG